MKRILIVTALLMLTGCATGSPSSSTPPTSQLPPLADTCSIVTVGETVLSVDALVCGENGKVYGPTPVKCVDGSTLVSAAGQFYWLSGKPVQAGQIPDAVRVACTGAH